MSEYLQFKRKIEQRVEIIEETIQELEKNKLVEKSAASRWRDHLTQVKGSLQDSLLRVAVVGSVKSGKSTLINALAGKDLLKRGAGIITAFITRILTNGDIGGWVELKPWSQIADEMNTAIRMLPISQEAMDEGEVVDVRSSEDRKRLKEWLGKTQEEWQQTRGQLDPNFILLNAYLDGYKGLHKNVGDSVNRLIFDKESLSQHQRYVGQEGQAVYIRDMELHYPVPWLGDKIEVADCQGSDSPNPLHLSLLQQYLLKCHFILYIISSRTGLREADFKLLDFIKTLRMFPQTLFILNSDLDVHNHEEDLDELTERVRTELSWIVANPELYSFSALYHLIDELDEAAPERDRRRLEMWREDNALVARTEEGYSRFREDMARRISSQRTRVLLGSGLSRLSMVAGSINDTTRAHKRFMNQNLGSLKKSSKHLKSKQKALQGTLGTLENAIAGLKESLRKELDNAVGSYFDLSYGPLIKETMDMVEHYPVDPQYQKDLSDYRQLLLQLHRFYMEFRQSLARYLIEKVNLRVIEFAKEQEEFLQDRLKHSSRAFWSLFTTALEDYRKELAQFDIELRVISASEGYDWSAMEKITPPSFSAFVDEQVVGRGTLLMKFGLGRLTRFLNQLKGKIGRRKSPVETKSEESQSFQEAVSLVKSETKSELMYDFRDYRQNFKYGYLYKILDEGTAHLLEAFKSRAEMAQLDFANLLKQSEVAGEERQQMMEALTRIGQISEAMVEELDGFRCAVNLDWMPCDEKTDAAAKETSKSAGVP
ncbi:MAG: dynamin family protein [Desulfoferrobacter sp.]